MSGSIPPLKGGGPIVAELSVAEKIRAFFETIRPRISGAQALELERLHEELRALRPDAKIARQWTISRPEFASAQTTYSYHRNAEVGGNHVIESASIDWVDATGSSTGRAMIVDVQRDLGVGGFASAQFTATFNQDGSKDQIGRLLWSSKFLVSTNFPTGSIKLASPLKLGMNRPFLFAFDVAAADAAPSASIFGRTEYS